MKMFKIEDIVNISTGDVLIPKLEGKDGEVVNTEDFFKGILTHIEEEMTDQTSYLYNKVFPLLTYGLMPILDTAFNQTSAVKLMSDSAIRHVLTYCIITGFVALKAIQAGDYTIITEKKQISQETLDYVDKQKEILKVIDECKELGLSTEETIQRINNLEILKKKPQDN